MKCVVERVVLFAIVMPLGLPGCYHTPDLTWSGTHNLVRMQDDGSEYVYGSQHSTVNSQGYKLFVVARGVFNATKGEQGKFAGTIKFQDEGTVTWSSESLDGQSGRIRVEAQEFELAEGQLFLISKNDQGVQVQQLVIRPEQLRTCADAKKILHMLKGHPSAEPFLQSCMTRN